MRLPSRRVLVSELISGRSLACQVAPFSPGDAWTELLVTAFMPVRDSSCRPRRVVQSAKTVHFGAQPLRSEACRCSVVTGHRGGAASRGFTTRSAVYTIPLNCWDPNRTPEHTRANRGRPLIGRIPNYDQRDPPRQRRLRFRHARSGLFAPDRASQ
jgi:hypothetical protein